MSGDSSSFRREAVQARNTVKYAEHFFRRIPVVAPMYETDSSDLLPIPKKNGYLGVMMAESSAVRVQAKPEQTNTFEPTVRPAIQFRGRLAIAELEDEDVSLADQEATEVDDLETELDLEENGEAEATETETEIKTDFTPATSAHGYHEIPVVHPGGRGPLNRYTKTQLNHLEPLSNPDGIIGEQRAHIVDRNPRDHTLVVRAPLSDSRISTPFIVAVTGVMALVMAVGLVGIHTTVTVDANSLTQVYTFTLGDFVQLVRKQITALIVHSFLR